jgi:Cu/Ag efflux protein CusF
LGARVPAASYDVSRDAEALWEVCGTLTGDTMMRLWKVALLVNLALVLGVAGGYLRWGWEARRLREELQAARQPAPARPTAEQSWTVRGIVRATLPSLGAVILTHEAMPGLMDAMTMGFEAQDPKLLDGLAPGDRVRFTVRYTGERIVLVAIEKDAAP